MTAEQFIEKAIEGGWMKILNKNTGVEGLYCDRHWTDDFDAICTCEGQNLFGNKHKALLDPKAWQAVGKVEGWTKAGEFTQRDLHFRGLPLKTIDEWLHHQHQMIDALAEGKSIEDYLKKL